MVTTDDLQLRERARIVHASEKSVPLLIPGPIAGRIPFDVFSSYQGAAEAFHDAKEIEDKEERNARLKVVARPGVVLRLGVKEGSRCRRVGTRTT